LELALVKGFFRCYLIFMFGLRNVGGTLLLAAVLGLASCDKAKLAVDAAREKFRGAGDPDAPAMPGGQVAPDMASQVDSAAEGVRFRRDLPFPTNLRVKATQTRSYQNGRRISVSALGTESAKVDFDWETVAVLDRRAQRVGITIERSGEVARSAEGEKKSEEKAAPAPTTGTLFRIDFTQGPKGWRVVKNPGPADFETKLREQVFLPIMDSLTSYHGLASRTQWFSASRRWAAGDRLVLEGDSLQVLFPPKSTGKITLVYEVSEPIDGHPCGRFAISGDVALKNEALLSGQLMDREASIKSGKVWCSLLHPLVLREEYEAVVTESEGSGGGPKSKFQGSVKVVNTWQWQKAGES
jgi:hypothetical protein